jgi:ectoine hydroxylase-related dioxygenase (phytanoyl-CoA dioxygenase family)
MSNPVSVEMKLCRLSRSAILIPLRFRGAGMVENLQRASFERRHTAVDAASAYRANGYFLFRQAVDRRLIDEVAKAEETVVRPYGGPLLRHNGKLASHDHSKGPPSDFVRRQSGLLNPHRMKEDSLRTFTEAAIRLLSSEAVFNCLHRLDGSERYTLHQSIFFFASARTDTHLDRVTLDTVPRGRSFTVWMPLDPVRPANGPLFVVPRPLDVHDDDLDGIAARGGSRGEMTTAFNEALAEKLAASDAEGVLPMMQPGDVMIFGPSTPHGSFAALDAGLWRRAFQAIYRPTSITRWGAYPTHDEPHDVQSEEEEMTSHFNFLLAR